MFQKFHILEKDHPGADMLDLLESPEFANIGATSGPKSPKKRTQHLSTPSNTKLSPQEVDLFYTLKAQYDATVRYLFEAFSLKDRLNNPATAQAAIRTSPVAKVLQKKNKRHSKKFEDLRTHDQVMQVDRMTDEIVRGKLKLGQLMRTVRSQDWSKFDRTEWNTV